MSGTGAPLTIGSVVSEARAILNDTVELSGMSYRYSDADLVAAINAAIREARAKRPDLFLALGMRVPLPLYSASDFALAFPLDPAAYDAVVYYVVGRAELREDTFTNDARCTTLMNKFVSQLLQVAS